MGDTPALAQAETRDPDGGATSRSLEPQVVGFLCNWCSYAGADLAGTSRLAYPANLRVIRVMCSGRVDPELMLEPFLRGADAVMVLGCHPGDCHYLTGNHQAEERVHAVRAILGRLRIDPCRICLDWVSAAEGARFADVVADYVALVRSLGRAGDERAKERLPRDEFVWRIEVARQVVAGERFRWLVGRRKALVEEANVYGERVSVQKADALVEAIVADECVRAAIEVLASKSPVSVRDVASRLGLSPRIVFEHFTFLKRRGVLDVFDVRDASPRYVPVGVNRG